MDERYPVTLKLSPKEYNVMCQIASAHYHNPVESACSFDIATYLHNIVSDLVLQGEVSRRPGFHAENHEFRNQRKDLL